SSPQEISEAISVAAEHGLSVSPLGGKTRTDLGNVPESLDLAIDTTGLDQVLVHNAADLMATVEAGITVSRLQDVLAEHGQFLAIDPPLSDRATIGGTLAVGWSGPMTWQNWSPRDIVIGMRTVMANGTITKTGGQVVKNVSGYDMARMHIGALGTLGIITEVSFKLTPLPARQATVMATFDSDANCLGAAL
ncbi:MAG: FAD-binding oxidoreductase, partial [Chloroflexota bacterium]|nr:FAD-binding oxidoreductase [Chloroflexota bacterium]